jgi:peptidyl-dipeptidase Dcp
MVLSAKLIYSQSFMKKISTVIIAVSILLYSCTSPKKDKTATDNPFLQDYGTQFNAPPFEKIKTEHFMPAYTEGFSSLDKEIEAIVKNTSKPDFKNTIEALDFSGNLLMEVNSVFFNLLSANTNDTLQKISQEVAPLIARQQDNIMLNADLFKRVKAVYDEKDKLQLTQEQSKLLTDTYKRFIRGGSGLNAADQQKLREINKQLSTLTLKFADNVLAETNAYKLVIDKKDDLAGLPAGLVETASETAKENKMDGKWIFTLQNPSLIPFLTYASNRDLRKKIWEAYSTRCVNGNANDNKKIIDQIANLRLDKAKLMGYKTYAAFALDDVMAKTPDNVYSLLNKLWVPALKVAKKEAKELQEMMAKDGISGNIEPYDWRYYSEKVRKAKYDLNEEELMPYFELNNVKQGVFDVASKLYGMKFIERKDVPKYHPDAVTYEVIDAAGNYLALLYMDFYTRASKNSGAWMTNFRAQWIQDKKETRPIVSLVLNFPKPTATSPSLLTYDEVTTLFHEFGHGLHGMLSKCTYPGVSGTAVPRDFVELPSQIMENWAGEPEVLKMFAKHYKTGEVIPQNLIDKLNKSSLFNQGFTTVEYLAASILDMDYHIISNKQSIDPIQFETESMKKIGLIPEIISRYKSAYFKHSFSTGYEAGYYSYIWAAILDADAFEAFRKNGLFDKTTADAFRTNILERGGTDDPMKLYKQFRGADPDIKPLLKRRGLDQ